MLFFYCSSLMVSYIFMLVGVLISVAFMVLLERSVLGYIQIRKGPNKVGFIGVLQSFGDAIKLFLKGQSLPLASNFFLFYVSPIISLFIVLVLWCLIPYYSFTLSLKLGGLLFFCCLSFGVYTLIGSGWASNSIYALLGAMRGVAQTISYEVSMAVLFICLVFFLGSYNLNLFTLYQDVLWLCFLGVFLFFIWVSSILAETNRTPFDFAEGESELVSGFNIEYGSGGFALLFLAEYGSIIFMSYLSVYMFLGGLSDSSLFFNLSGVLLCFMFIWVRGSFPRYRYDKLMYLAWKSFLPSVLFFFCYYLMVVLFIFWVF